MQYRSVNEIAKKWNVSERSVPIKRKSSQLYCWIFYKSRRQVRIPVVFTIRHRLT